MMDPRPLLNLIGDRLHALPLLVVYLTDGCNSKCITCDIWRLPRRNMPLELAEHLAADFEALGVREVLLSGGEALQHPEWPRIALTFREAGARLLLVTNGLLLARHVADVAALVDEVTVSLDAATPALYEAIRGIDGLGVVLEGIRVLTGKGVPVTTRTTVQKANFHQLPDVVRLGEEVGVRRVSFLAVDVKSAEAFGPRGPDTLQIVAGGPGTPEGHGPPAHLLSQADLTDFDAILTTMEVEFASEFASGFIAESPAKLRRLRAGLAASMKDSHASRPRCNAPHTSAVIEVDGRIRSCYFLPVTGQLRQGMSLHETLNGPQSVNMRHAYRKGHRAECVSCVCPLYRGPRSLLRQVVST